MKELPLFLLSAFFLCAARASDRHMICKDVDNVFGEPVGGPGPPPRQFIGSPGKKGPEGPPGLKGEPGEVDYSTLRGTIEQIVQSQLEEKLLDIYEKINQLNATKSGKQSTGCSVDTAKVYKNKCYWLTFQPKNDVAFARAKSLCAEEGGKVGDVLSQEHYDMIVQMFRSQSTETKWFWTGTTVNPVTKVATYSDGTRANFLKWYSSSYPSTGSINTGVLIQIGGNPSSGHGMYNRGPGNTAFGSLCQS